MSESLTRPMGRVWPTGEFCLWTESKKPVSGPDPADPLGLSKVANSHRPEDEGGERARRGLGGISNYGQKMVKSAAWILQQRYGARQLSFLTCTIPGNPDETFRVALEWPEIVRQFYQGLQRALMAKNMCTYMVGVTEIQPKRFLRDGGMPLHLHVVFRGAVEDYRWCFTPSELTKLWKRAVCNRIPSMAEHSFVASTNVQKVKKSASSYLGKYMSKGAGDIQQILKEAPGVIDAIPSSWYNMSANLRQATKQNVAYGPEVGALIESWLPRKELRMDAFRYISLVKIRDESGDVIASFHAGTLEGWAKRRVGLAMDSWSVRGLE